MSDQDPCQGCRHLVSRDGFQTRPYCTRGAFYGDRHCRREPAGPPVGAASGRDGPNRWRRG